MAGSWRFELWPLDIFPGLPLDDETCLAGKPPFYDAEDTQIYSSSGFIAPVPTAILEKIKYIHYGVYTLWSM